MIKKLGVIVPYRNRYEQLIQFKSEITKYLNSKSINFELIIVEQDDAKVFNRGKLLNIGFKYAKKLDCDYVVFHDVDMIPIDVDYSYSEYPVHLASRLISNKTERIIFDEYFGGVTIFPINDFELVNGYSNEYWGWGFEDDDLLFRCKVSGLNLVEKQNKMMGGNVASLKFNGHNAYVESKNRFNLNEPITFFISFYPDDINCNLDKYDDTYSVFSIPGLDLNINYNSYQRYNFEIYDEYEKIQYINSELKTNYFTNVCVTINPIKKIIKMFQDGILINEKTYLNNLYNYETVRKFYLGVGNLRNKENQKFYKGLINSFAAFNKVLNETEIKEISNNQYFGLTQNFGDYVSASNVILYYDAKFIKNYKLIDLSGNGNDGNIKNCEITGHSFDGTKITYQPYRRNCSFMLMDHDENGFVNGAWKDITTRYNQMRYYNEVVIGGRNIKNDGLNNCKFKELSNTNLNNETHVTVSI
jgi:beta-1,4-galactosyltransferase 1